MLHNVGRPREHDEQTAARLLDVAERVVDSDGVAALSVRRVAREAGTTTRAVYSLFGSKDGLAVALGTRAFELLRTAIGEHPATSDPAADLAEAGVTVFRRFVVDHPSLYAIGFQKLLPAPELAAEFRATSGEALAGLKARVARLEPSGLGGRTVQEATTEFHALCEGLAALELRGLLPAGEEERIWHNALSALVYGFAAVPRSVP